MTCQQTALWSEPDVQTLPSYLGDFHANHTRLLENVWHLMMSVICGVNSLECFETLTPDGLWQRMWGGCLQAKMDDFLEEFSGTWPASGAMCGGTVSQPMRLARYIPENGLPLLPAPIATDYKGSYKDAKKLKRHIQSKDHQVRICELLLACGTAKKDIPTEYEVMMGFPIGHTELNASVTP